jgi:hypothetical protein
MFGYLINPVTKTIDIVQIEKDKNGGSLKSVKEYLGCDYVDLAGFNNGSPEIDFDLWIDDEGLLKENQQSFFYITHPDGAAYGHRFFAGKGIVLASDNEGESISPTVNYNFLKNVVIWEMPSDGKRKAEKILARGPQIIQYDSIDELLDAVYNTDKYEH